MVKNNYPATIVTDTLFETKIVHEFFKRFYSDFAQNPKKFTRKSVGIEFRFNTHNKYKSRILSCIFFFLKKSVRSFMDPW